MMGNNWNVKISIFQIDARKPFSLEKRSTTGPTRSCLVCAAFSSNGGMLTWTPWHLPLMWSKATQGLCGPVDCGVERWRNRCSGISMRWQTWVGGTLKTGPQGVWANWWVISDKFITKDGRFATSLTPSLPPSILLNWCWLFWAIHNQGWPTHWKTVGNYI